MCVHGRAIACALKQTFAQCDILLQGVLFGIVSNDPLICSLTSILVCSFSLAVVAKRLSASNALSLAALNSAPCCLCCADRSSWIFRSVSSCAKCCCRVIRTVVNALFNVWLYQECSAKKEVWERRCPHTKLKGRFE